MSVVLPEQRAVSSAVEEQCDDYRSVCRSAEQEMLTYRESDRGDECDGKANEYGKWVLRRMQRVDGNQSDDKREKKSVEKGEKGCSTSNEKSKCV